MGPDARCNKGSTTCGARSIAFVEEDPKDDGTNSEDCGYDNPSNGSTRETRCSRVIVIWFIS